MKFVTAFTSPRVSVRNDEPSLTKQSFVEETDINLLAKKYIREDVEYSPAQIAAQIAAVTGNGAMTYGDVSNATSLDDAMALVAEIQDTFNTLPATIRARFNNSPVALVDFIDNPANKAEAQALGLIEKDLPISPAGAPVQPAQEAGAVDKSGATSGAPE